MKGQIAIYKKIAFMNNRDTNMCEREREICTLWIWVLVWIGNALIMNNKVSHNVIF